MPLGTEPSEAHPAPGTPAKETRIWTAISDIDLLLPDGTEMVRTFVVSMPARFAHVSAHGTTLMPIDFACAITLLHSPSRLRPDSRISLCLILAIS